MFASLTSDYNKTRGDCVKMRKSVTVLSIQVYEQLYDDTPASSALLEEPAYITSDNNIISGHNVKMRIILSISGL